MINLNIAVVSNIILEPHLLTIIKSRFGKEVEIFPISYGEHIETENKDLLTESDIIIVWLNFEALFPDVWNMLYEKVKSDRELIDNVYLLCERLFIDLMTLSKAKLVWFLFEDYYTKMSFVEGNLPLCNALIDRINENIQSMVSDNCIAFIDLKRLIAEVGIIYSYDSKGKYRWNAPYSQKLVNTAVDEIYKRFLIEQGITKKCLILDCDNVLWGEIISEDGIKNIKLGSSAFGRAYQDFQRFVLSLYFHGVILAICSKNDMSDVMTMFREHSEMILKEKHIACFQVNWDNKINNIKKIANTLNISLESMVFIDDSPIEIEAVKAMLPEVSTILYKFETVYEQLSCFNLSSNIDLSRIEKRNETYHTTQIREGFKSKYNSYDEYIAALNVKIDIHEANPIEFSRISEITQRTNKCTNGKRYSITEIRERSHNPAVKLYSLIASDCFSDLGLVGTIEVENDTLTLFSLSCRALGRKIEERMLSFISDMFEIKNIEFYTTNNNKNIEELLFGYFDIKNKMCYTN